MKLFLHIAASAALLFLGNSVWAQQASENTSSKPPMQAQELAILVPKDSSQPKPVDISRGNIHNNYYYDKKGTNCSLYPARCRGESD